MNQTVRYSHKYNPSKRKKKYSHKYDKHHQILDPHRFWEKCKKIKEKTIKSHFMIICAFVGLQFMIGAVQYSHNSDKPQYMNFHILDPRGFWESKETKNLITLSIFGTFVGPRFMTWSIHCIWDLLFSL